MKREKRKRVTAGWTRKRNTSTAAEQEGRAERERGPRAEGRRQGRRKQVPMARAPRSGTRA